MGNYAPQGSAVSVLLQPITKRRLACPVGSDEHGNFAREDRDSKSGTVR